MEGTTGLQTKAAVTRYSISRCDILFNNYGLPERIVEWIPLILEILFYRNHSSGHVENATDNTKELWE